jgi:hypothetical protein
MPFAFDLVLLYNFYRLAHTDSHGSSDHTMYRQLQDHSKLGVIKSVEFALTHSLYGKGITLLPRITS